MVAAAMFTFKTVKVPEVQRFKPFNAFDVMNSLNDQWEIG